MTIDEMCEDALRRMTEAADVKFEAFRKESRQRYFFMRRSISQKARRIREELLRGMK